METRHLLMMRWFQLSTLLNSLGWFLSLSRMWICTTTTGEETSEMVTASSNNGTNGGVTTLSSSRITPRLLHSTGQLPYLT
jgi:hypothetical protein